MCINQWENAGPRSTYTPEDTKEYISLRHKRKSSPARCGRFQSGVIVYDGLPFYGNKLAGRRLWSSNWRMRFSGPRANGRKPRSKKQLLQEIKTKRFENQQNKTGFSRMTLKCSRLIVAKGRGGWRRRRRRGWICTCRPVRVLSPEKRGAVLTQSVWRGAGESGDP